MGETVEFPSNGKTCAGYLAVPDSTAPGVIVIQEWWGLVDHIKDVCDRFAAEGFVALAPDLYHGRATKEPDEAGKLLMAMDIERAGRDMAGAVDYLLNHPVVEPKKVGSVGFCMGGNMALLLASLRPVQAAVAFYPYPRTQPDLSKVQGAVLAHIAEHDQAPSPEMAEKLVSELRSYGRDAEFHVYPGTDHGFFNDTRADVYKLDSANQAWGRTVSFFRRHLG